MDKGVKLYCKLSKRKKLMFPTLSFKIIATSLKKNNKYRRINFLFHDKPLILQHRIKG